MESRKMFSSSWFYEEDSNVYPTIEEQVQMCRKIASQLVNEENKESKGASMFYKRVKRSEKWVTPGVAPGESAESRPFLKKEPPTLKLILDPRRIDSLQSLREKGIPISEHNAVSPEVCLDIVKDLKSPDAAKNKGAAIFMRRKEKSAEWIVSENQVTEKIRQEKRRKEELERAEQRPATPQSKRVPQKILVQPTIKLVKTPWEAALETGNVDNAFVEERPPIAESIINAAKQKQCSQFAPKGWKSSWPEEEAPRVEEPKASWEPKQWLNFKPFSMPKFRDFNSVPRGFKRC